MPSHDQRVTVRHPELGAVRVLRDSTYHWEAQGYAVDDEDTPETLAEQVAAVDGVNEETAAAAAAFLEAADPPLSTLDRDDAIAELAAGVDGVGDKTAAKILDALGAA